MTVKVKQKAAYDIHKLFSLLLIVIPVGVIGNVAFSFFTTDIHTFSELSNVSLPFFALAVILAFTPWLTNLLRLRTWTVFLGKKYGVMDLTSVVMGQELGAALTPTAVGGGYIKAGMLMKLGLDSGRSISVMFLSGLEDIAILLLFAPMAVAMVFSRNPDMVAGLRAYIKNPILTAVFIAVFLLLSLLLYRFLFRNRRNKKCGNETVIDRFKNKMDEFVVNFASTYKLIWKRGKARFLLCVLYAAVGWLCRFAVIVALLKSLNLPVDFFYQIALQWFVFNLMNVVPTPGAAIGAEAVFFLVYSSLYSQEMIGLLIIGWRFLTFYVLNITAAILFLSLRGAGKKESREPDTTLSP